MLFWKADMIIASTLENLLPNLLNFFVKFMGNIMLIYHNRPEFVTEGVFVHV